LTTLLDRFLTFSHRHTRSIAGAVAVLLAGSAATAFGIAPLMDQVDRLPQRTVVEEVSPHDVASQLESLALHELELHRSDLTRSSDTADSLLRRLGVEDAAAAKFLRSDPVARKLFEGQAGKMVTVRADQRGALDELVVRFAATESRLVGTHFTRLVVRRDGSAWQSEVETLPLVAQVRLGGGTIESSLFAATDAARIPDAVASQLADVFGSEIDFHRDLRRGDHFTVVYEALTADGEPITWGSGTGRVLAAEFVNKGEAHNAMWFTAADGRGAYFGLDGRSKTGAFLASPLAFSRVTSGFAARMHPLLKQWRQHRGIDYAAPTGTQVRSVGDGIVRFAGWQNGYGQVVEIEHANGRATLYAHLSRIAVQKGERVVQGDPIGAVGATGWATGPHLHFEFKVAGVNRNPTELARVARDTAISETDKQRLGSLAALVRGQLDTAQSVVGTLETAE
jgi:murein DD-endopeptidase MepM/ murein hydrolase activator NlpD